MPPRKRKAIIEGTTGQVERKKKKATRPIGPTRITRGMTTDASRKAVLDTTELLENIILHLPARNIFGVQRVCQTFRNVIKTSTGIQQKLFLRPSPQKPQVWELRTLTGGDAGDLRMVWHFEDLSLKFMPCADGKGASEGLEATSAASNPAHRKVPVQLNPLLKMELPLYWDSLTLLQRSAIGCDWHTRLDLGNAPLMQPQSWRSMLISDPPPLDIGLVYLNWRLKGQGRYHYITADLSKYPEIHTLGSLVDATLALKRRRPGDSDKTTMQTYGDYISAAEAAKGSIARFKAHDGMTIGLRGVVVPSEEEWHAMEELGEVV